MTNVSAANFEVTIDIVATADHQSDSASERRKRPAGEPNIDTDGAPFTSTLAGA